MAGESTGSRRRLGVNDGGAAAIFSICATASLVSLCMSKVSVQQRRLDDVERGMDKLRRAAPARRLGVEVARCGGEKGEGSAVFIGLGFTVRELLDN